MATLNLARPDPAPDEAAVHSGLPNRRPRAGVSSNRMQRRPGRVIPFPQRAADSPPRAGERSLVEVRRCDQAEAVVVKSLLESEDIPAFLRSRLTHSVHPFTVGAQGEVV